MGLLAHLPFVLVLLLGVFVSGFALAASRNPSAHALYEDYLKDPLETFEFAFTWTGSLYFVLPMVAFTAAKDWTKIFFDCFTTVTLWFDVLYSAIILLFFLLFVGDITENFGRIIIEFTGLALQLASVFGYVMLKSAHDDKFDHAEARKQNTCALIFFKAFGFGMLLQLQGKLIVPESYCGIALWLSLGGMLLQFLQLASSMYYRWVSDFSRHGATLVIELWVIVFLPSSLAMIRVVTQSYDCWLYTARGYWDSASQIQLARMTAVSLAVNCALALSRYVGPSKLKAGFDDTLAWLVTRPHRINTAWKNLILWVKGDLMVATLDAAKQKAAERQVTVAA